MTAQVVSIGVAVVENEGRFLVGRRPQGAPLAGFAEFPGGKCRRGEAGDACACRECFEETGLQVIAVRLLHSCEHQYEHGRVGLEFWLCRPARGADVAEKHERFGWIRRGALPSLPFPAANAPVIDMLLSAKTSDD